MRQAMPGEAVPSQWDIPVLMSVPDLTKASPATPLSHAFNENDKKPLHGELPSREFKLSVPPVATLGGLIGVAIVLVLVLLSRGGDETAEKPVDAANEPAPELKISLPTDSKTGQPAGKAQMARLGLEDAPDEKLRLTKSEGKKEKPYLPTADPAIPQESNPVNPRFGTKPTTTAPSNTQQGQYPRTNTPQPFYLEAKRPDRSASTRPPVELEGTIANPNFRARNESQRSRVH